MYLHIFEFFPRIPIRFSGAETPRCYVVHVSWIFPGGVQLFAWSPRWEIWRSSGEKMMTTRLWMPLNHESTKMRIFVAQAIFVSPNLVSIIGSTGLTKQSFWDYQLHCWHFMNWYITSAPFSSRKLRTWGLRKLGKESLVERGKRDIHNFTTSAPSRTNRIETQMPWSTHSLKLTCSHLKILMIERLLSGATWVLGWFLIYFLNNFGP